MMKFRPTYTERWAPVRGVVEKKSAVEWLKVVE